jgi:hypothetical protein
VTTKSKPALATLPRAPTGYTQNAAAGANDFVATDAETKRAESGILRLRHRPVRVAKQSHDQFKITTFDQWPATVFFVVEPPAFPGPRTWSRLSYSAAELGAYWQAPTV